MNIEIIAFVSIFVLGTIIGSFLNVVIYRFNSGLSIAKGRSMCMSCSKTLRYYELIPIFSFLIQKGKCRSCGSKISFQYILVEFVTALIFLFTSMHFSYLIEYQNLRYVWIVSLYTFMFSLLVVMAVYDYKHKIIPDKLVYLFSVLAFASIFLNVDFSTNSSVFILPNYWAILAGPILALPFAFLWVISKGEWIGFGDAKLVLGLGFLLGVSKGFASIIIAFWIGAVVGIILILINKRTNMKTQIPFAPFLILAFFLVFFLSIDINSISNLFIF